MADGARGSTQGFKMTLFSGECGIVTPQHESDATEYGHGDATQANDNRACCDHFKEAGFTVISCADENHCKRTCKPSEESNNKKCLPDLHPFTDSFDPGFCLRDSWLLHLIPSTSTLTPNMILSDNRAMGKSEGNVMTMNTMAWHNPTSAMVEKDYAMSDENKNVDNQGTPIDWGEVMTSWMTITQAAKEIGIRRQSVHEAITRGTLRAVKIGNEDTPNWYWKVDPESVADYAKRDR